MTGSDLQKIPGVGKSISADLQCLGINCINDLRNKNPEELYQSLMEKVGFPVDRCVLYVFRCAVYYAEHEQHDPEKLKWWHWKDANISSQI